MITVSMEGTHWYSLYCPLQRGVHIAEVALYTHLCSLGAAATAIAFLPSLETCPSSEGMIERHGDGSVKLNFKPGHHCMPSITNLLCWNVIIVEPLPDGVFSI